MRMQQAVASSLHGNPDYYLPETLIRLQAAMSRLDVFWRKVEFAIHRGAQLALSQQRNDFRRECLGYSNLLFQGPPAQHRTYQVQPLSHERGKIYFSLPSTRPSPYRGQQNQPAFCCQCLESGGDVTSSYHIKHHIEATPPRPFL